jgi:hypothetical protein
MPTDLKQERDRLLELARRGEDPDARAELLAALQSKWEGLQLTAARALMKRPDPVSTAAVKELLVGIAATQGRFSACSILADALAPHLRGEDIPWVMDLFFGSSRRANRRSMTELFRHLPKGAVLEAIRLRKQVDNVDPRDEKDAIG